MKYPIVALFLILCLQTTAQTTVFIQPHFAAGNESNIFSLNPTLVGYTTREFNMIAWTNSGALDTQRHLIKFDALTGSSVIPGGASVLSAKLVLCGMPSSPDGNYGNSNYPGSPYNSYGTNEGCVYPLAAPFDKYTVNWLTQPGVVDSDTVLTPVSYIHWNENDTIDVTATVGYLRTHGNMGMMFKLPSEVHYRERIWCSSMYSDSTKHPLLIVTYFCARLITGEPRPDTVLAGDTAKFFVSAVSPMVSFQWQEDPGTGFVDLANVWPYSGVNTDTLVIQDASTYLNRTHYRCVVTSDGACPDTSSSAILIIRMPPTTDVNQLSKSTLTIYPNPAKNELTVTGDNISSISIYNMVGQTVYERAGLAKESVLNVSSFPAGVYMMTITDVEGAKTIRKFVKE